MSWVSARRLQYFYEKIKTKFAPSGFGLGETATMYYPSTEEEMNTMLTECVGKLPNNSTGCFVFCDNTGNIWGGSTCHATVFKTNSLYAFVTFDGYYHSNCNRFTKTLYNGNWLPMAWENPHMLPGVEYRTTERWNGKVVYTKLINCGKTTEGISQIAHGSQIGNHVGFSAVLLTENNGESIAIPWFKDTDNYIYVTAAISGGVVMNAKGQYVGRTVYALLKYTKD